MRVGRDAVDTSLRGLTADNWFGLWIQLSANDSYRRLRLSVSTSFTLFIQYHYPLGNRYTSGIQLPQAVILSSHVVW